VNRFIRQNTAVTTRIMTPDDARAIGAQALFGEKYGDEVRVVSMGEAETGKGPDGRTWSIELCGGTHVARTGDIGAFVTLGDSASSAGVRRIEALTGQAALDYLQGQDHRLAEAALALKSSAAEVPDRIRALLDERKMLLQEVEQLRLKVSLGGSGAAETPEDEVGGVKMLGQVVDGVAPKQLRALIDGHKDRMGSGVICLIAANDGKAAVAVGVTDDLTGRISAVDLVKLAVAEVGGLGGGGRADFAQGGGPDVENADAALAAVKGALA